VAHGHRRSSRSVQAWNSLPAWPLDPPRLDGNGHSQNEKVSASGRSPTVGDQPQPRRDQPRANARADYWCRACHRAETTGGMPPAGWLRLQGRHLEADRAWYTQGLYCSPECLAADLRGDR
jgi:hypothetical protein